MSLENIPELFRQRIQEASEQQLEELDLSYEHWADGCGLYLTGYLTILNFLYQDWDFMVVVLLIF